MEIDLRQWRQEMRYTLKEAASALNIPLGTYKDQEYGRVRVNGAVLKLADIFLNYQIIPNNWKDYRPEDYDRFGPVEMLGN